MVIQNIQLLALCVCNVNFDVPIIFRGECLRTIANVVVTKYGGGKKISTWVSVEKVPGYELANTWE